MLKTYKVSIYRGYGLGSNCYNIEAENYDEACFKSGVSNAPPGWITTVELVKIHD